MQVAIIGHGPSILSVSGKLIDEHDFIIRQKNCGEMLKYPDRFGSRTDATVGSINQIPILRAIGAECWVFIDSRFEDVTEEQLKELENDKSQWHASVEAEIEAFLESNHENQSRYCLDYF